jgi:DNA-binding CsgD family transcriptional regulator
MKNAAANSRQRATRTVEQRPSPNDTANAELSASGKEALQCSLMHRNRAESPTLAAVKVNPESRLNAAQQLQILDMFLAGYGYSAIARQLHRNRRTVTRICKSPEIEAKMEELKGRLLGESDDWVESINFAVRHEMDGRLAYQLAKDFGVIPSPAKNLPAEKQNSNSWESIDPHRLAMARELGLEAMRRASAMRLEDDQLEKLAQKDKVQPVRKCRLFDSRD